MADSAAPASETATSEPHGRLWLSHHYACHADRCVSVGGTPVCRRCLAMFAGFFPALIVLLSPWRDGLQAGDMGLVLALTIVAGLEFVQVARGEFDYSARRVLGLSPFVGAMLAWLGVTGARDGFGPVHLVLGGTALGLLVMVLMTGTVVRRANPS